MGQQDRRMDRVAQHMTRRRAIAGGATLLAGGGTLLLVSEGVAADVTVDSLDIPDESFEADGIDPTLDVTAAYSYSVEGASVGSLVFDVGVDGGVVASDELMTDETALQNTTALSGPVLDSPAWDAADFDPAIGETVEQTLSVSLRFAVLDVGGGEIVADEATTECVVTVSHPQESAYTAAVGGEGVVTDGSA